MAYLEIIIHSYKYAKLLNLELSSHYIYGENFRKDIKYIVYTCKEDKVTNDVCDFFSDKLNLEKRILPLKTLAARGYGRNMAVNDSNSNWIWFADADHLISENSLKSLFDILNTTKYKLLFPSLAIKNKYGEDVDYYLKTIDVPNIIDFDFEKIGMETSVKRHRVASGGVQIFKTECIKKVGYAYRHKQHDDWVSCKDDRRARRKFSFEFPNSISPIIMDGHRHLTHATKRRMNHDAEL